jgi:hypothetical protein
LLDQHIAETEFAMKQKSMAAMAQMMGPMEGSPGGGGMPGEMSGDAIAGAQGAMANPGGMQ